MATPYPQLAKSDDKLLNELFDILSRLASTTNIANPYNQESDGFANLLLRLPPGLRAMAATYWLDISLTKDDIVWHFLNFGQTDFVRLTEAGLRELGLDQHADWFHQAYQLYLTFPEINNAADYYDYIRKTGVEAWINEVSDKARRIAEDRPRDSPIFAAWIRYARTYPERIFDL